MQANRFKSLVNVDNVEWLNMVMTAAFAKEILKHSACTNLLSVEPAAQQLPQPPSARRRHIVRHINQPLKSTTSVVTKSQCRPMSL